MTAAEAVSAVSDDVLSAIGSRGMCLLVNRDVLKQLGREFWLPGSLASAWAIYGWFFEPNPTIAASITRFSAAFFFLSWLSGQVFRVSKQTRTERSFNSIEERVGTLLNNLAKEADDLRGFATGGESFARLSFAGSFVENPMMLATHYGRHPLYDVTARIVDPQLLHQATGQNSSSFEKHDPSIYERFVRVGDLTPGLALTFPDIQSHGLQDRDRNIFFSARNGTWVQEYRERLVKGVRRSATLIMRDTGHNLPRQILLAEHDQHFPLADLPSDWPTGGNDTSSSV